MSDYRIESIALKDVGVFDDVEIVFPKIESAAADEKKAEIHLFTGPNGCGKSTLLYALASCLGEDGYKLIRERKRGTNGCVSCSMNGWGFSTSSYDNPMFMKTYRQQGYSLIYDYHSDKEQFFERKERASFKFAAFAYSGRRTLNASNVHNIVQIEDSPFDEALSFEGNTHTGNIAQWILNSLAESAVAEVAGDIQSAESYRFAVKRVEQFINEVCRLDMSFEIKRSPLTVKIKVGDDLLSFDVLPDGLKSIISWVADLAMRLDSIPWAEQRDIFSQNIILFLDEIDIHLHPKWQRRILPAVQKLLPNAQIFASTHSPFVVGSVEDAWVYKLPEKGQQKERIIKPEHSGAGKSYQLILATVFDITKDFDDATEQVFDDFYRLRNLYMTNKVEADKAQLLKIARELIDKGEEVKAIVARELRQMSRLMQEDIDIA